ncbi:hypothetical protein N0V93_006254 [Gnomoniopsis smithogilvyi]|uniref:Ams2/SPT21 N-terminal domain-containing protein n=1 Tax=Gnomoniopsis smithogilvyi TaxID=1191159 RepID=A0A9W8YPH5_9PEZI|nr:hypothetical protein N0V93_006254 [Gnomoniopsis smithogilvyi]
MTGPQGSSWMGYPPHGHQGQQSQPPPSEESGVQTRHMGLKVQYTFEKDQQNCLAKWPHVLQIQSIPLDDRNSIGLVDLRICLEAIAQCSPEIINQHDKDYAVYALDYAEEDTPLVGQGMLSWGLEPPGPNTEPKTVTGRVVKNMLAALRGGPPETLEVKLKLNGVPRLHRPQTSHNSAGGYGSNAPTPTATDNNNDWSSFVQSNPNLGRPNNVPAMPSPGFPPVRYGSPIQQAPSPAPDARLDMYAPQPQPPPPRGAPTPPTLSAAPVPSLSGCYFPPVPSSQGPGPEDAPPLPGLTKVDDSEKIARPKKTKRSSSKAPKKKAPTGNPPGRPRKRNRLDAGNTSAMEDATDADEAPAIISKKKTVKTIKAADDATDADEAPAEGPKKKRAKTTKADWPSKAPLNSASGSLRVAASTSGSLRTMRPSASGGNVVGASHLQEIPRAPTPVPGQPPKARGIAMGQAPGRRSSMADFDGSSRHMIPETSIHGAQLQDALSPSDSLAQSPFNAYTPDDSPADIGSSPPVPRSTHSVRSSLPPSSPVLPTMLSMPQPDSGFMSGGFDEMVDEYDLPLPVPPMSSNFPQPKILGKKKLAPKPPKSVQPKAPPPQLFRAQTARPASRGIPEPPPNVLVRPASQGIFDNATFAPSGQRSGSAPPKEMIIQQEIPGDPELLPKQSIYYTRPGSARNNPATGTIEETRQLKRANTEPNIQRQEIPDPTTGPLLPKPQLTAEVNTIGQVAQEPKGRENQVGMLGLEQREVEHSQQQQQNDHMKQELKEPDARLSDLPQEQQEPAEKGMQQPEAEGEPKTAGSDESADRQEAVTPAAPTPVVPETADDTEALLQLLAGPMARDMQDVDSDLPPVAPAEGPRFNNSDRATKSEAAGSMPPALPSDIGISAPSDLPGSGSSDGGNALTKNMSRKKSIKEKLEQAVQAGMMPTFCSNCGSISTPTWRKIWTQDSDGSPDIPDYSDEPGRITAIIILDRNENQKPTRYRTVKKTLAPAEDKSAWTEEILCNPCGLWLSKYRAQRPESKWETDFTQPPKTRVKGGRKAERQSRSRKGKGQGTTLVHPTSEAYYTTDPIGPDDQGRSPATDGEEVLLLRAPTTEPPSRERDARSQTAGLGDSFDASTNRASTQSRGSGAVQSPAIPEEDDMGNTRRLLFPSPKKDGQLKVLGEVAVNIVRTSASIERSKNAIVDKENLMDINMDVDLLSTPKIRDDGDAMRDLFGTPARPSTPPPKDRPVGPFKTPTRPTPSHRPITRSVSKSIRRSNAKSPGHTISHIHRTPTKTPRSSARLRNQGLPSASKIQHAHAHFTADDHFLGGMSTDFGSPFNSTLTQLLSEANDFTVGSDAHGLGDFELPMMDSDTGLSGHLEGLDFGHFLTTDAAMPSSPPMTGKNTAHVVFDANAMDFGDWGAFGTGDGNMDDVHKDLQ